MAKVHSDEFRREAVRIAFTSGQTRHQVAVDLGMTIQELRLGLRPRYSAAREMLEDAGHDVSDMDCPEAVKAAVQEQMKTARLVPVDTLGSQPAQKKEREQ